MTDAPWQIVRVLGTVLVLGPPVACYVYRDTNRRSRPHSLAWAVCFGPLGVAGLLAYLRVRGDFSGDRDAPE